MNKPRSKKEAIRLWSEEWSEDERLSYAAQADPHVESQEFLDGSKRVGDQSALSLKHRGLVGLLPVGKWKETHEEARSVAENFITHAQEELPPDQYAQD